MLKWAICMCIHFTGVITEIPAGNRFKKIPSKGNKPNSFALSSLLQRQPLGPSRDVSIDQSVFWVRLQEARLSGPVFQENIWHCLLLMKGNGLVKHSIRAFPLHRLRGIQSSPHWILVQSCFAFPTVALVETCLQLTHAGSALLSNSTWKYSG